VINFTVQAALTVVNETVGNYFALGSDAKVTIKVTNNIVQGQKVALLVGVFNTDNNKMFSGSISWILQIHVRI